MATIMHRLLLVILVLALGGCGALPVSTAPAEDSGSRLVGDSGSVPLEGSVGDPADPDLADNGDGASADEPPANPIPSDDPDAAGGDPAGAGGDTDMTDEDSPFEVPGGLPVGPIEPTTPDTVEPFDPFIFDSALLAFMDPELFADFLPFLTDILLLDALAPSGGSFADSFSYLELLCLDLDLPKTYCRGRYSN